MAYIKYKDSDTYIKADVLPRTKNIVRIFSSKLPNLSGFRMYLRGTNAYPIDKGEYEKYNTLYNLGDGWFELSNDGSVYVEPAAVEPMELTEEQKRENEREERISYVSGQIGSLKRELSQTDYKIIKAYEYYLVGISTEYDIFSLHEIRQSIRDHINSLESELRELMEEII